MQSLFTNIFKEVSPEDCLSDMLVAQANPLPESALFVAVIVDAACDAYTKKCHEAQKYLDKSESFVLHCQSIGLDYEWVLACIREYSNWAYSQKNRRK